MHITGRGIPKDPFPGFLMFPRTEGKGAPSLAVAKATDRKRNQDLEERVGLNSLGLFVP